MKWINFCVIITIGATAAKRLGEICTTEPTGELGECKLFDDCDRVLNDPITSKTCGSQGKEKMICCAIDKGTVSQRVKKEIKQERVPGTISKTKCKEYSKFVFERKKQPILLIGAPDIKKNECGHQVVKLIVGGEKALKKEFPHMALIGFESLEDPGGIEWKCGGTIISNKFILTAAHCLKSRYEVAKYVTVGIINLKDKSSRKQHIKIADRIQYPDYSSGSYYNDIGLLKLEKAIHLNPYARPACLNTNRNIESQLAITTGWGQTHFEGEINEDLLKVTLDLIEPNSCNSSRGFKNEKKLRNGILNEIQLCAGSNDPKIERDTCNGDSGGPLQVYHINDDIECMYDIIGVTSFGKACAGIDPGVYTRVSHYIKWIEDIVWP